MSQRTSCLPANGTEHSLGDDPLINHFLETKFPRTTRSTTAAAKTAAAKTASSTTTAAKTAAAKTTRSTTAAAKTAAAKTATSTQKRKSDFKESRSDEPRSKARRVSPGHSAQPQAQPSSNSDAASQEENSAAASQEENPIAASQEENSAAGSQEESEEESIGGLVRNLFKFTTMVGVKVALQKLKTRALLSNDLKDVITSSGGILAVLHAIETYPKSRYILKKGISILYLLSGDDDSKKWPWCKLTVSKSFTGQSRGTHKSPLTY